MSIPRIESPTSDRSLIRSVDRAVADLRRGDMILLEEPGGGAALVQAAETTDDAELASLSTLSGDETALVLTVRRARALGLQVPEEGPAGVVAYALAGTGAERIRGAVDPSRGALAHFRPGRSDIPAPELNAAAVDLMKIARLLPAALLAPVNVARDRAAWAAAHDLLLVRTDQVSLYRHAIARSLVQVANARLPLAGAERTHIVAFRPDDGGVEHLALIIGEPEPGQTVLTRLHSECFTGDLLGSLRCDCGEQLRGAIHAIAEAGSGVLIYLTQEGRGIGLVNKLRAYTLQDRGADTVEANEQLGFDADERLYLPAAEILRRLGFDRVRLLTNNPDKVAALTRCGITVEERVPHHFPSNGHNEFYLATKLRKFGHMF